MVGGIGAWLSTFTLAVTEVTERAQIPWLTLSYADSDHRPRLQVRVPDLADRPACNRTPRCRRSSSSPRRRPARRPTTAGIIGDNTASPVSFLKPMREGGLAEARHQGA